MRGSQPPLGGTCGVRRTLHPIAKAHEVAKAHQVGHILRTAGTAARIAELDAGRQPEGADRMLEQARATTALVGV